MKIATIYNDSVDMLIDVLYNPDSKEISYCLPSGEIENNNEHADSLEDAISDTYKRYYFGWSLEFVENLKEDE